MENKTCVAFAWRSHEVDTISQRLSCVSPRSQPESSGRSVFSILAGATGIKGVKRKNGAVAS